MSSEELLQFSEWTYYGSRRVVLDWLNVVMAARFGRSQVYLDSNFALTLAESDREFMRPTLNILGVTAQRLYEAALTELQIKRQAEAQLLEENRLQAIRQAEIEAERLRMEAERKRMEDERKLTMMTREYNLALHLHHTYDTVDYQLAKSAYRAAKVLADLADSKATVIPSTKRKLMVQKPDLDDPLATIVRITDIERSILCDVARRVFWCSPLAIAAETKASAEAAETKEMCVMDPFLEALAGSPYAVRGDRSALVREEQRGIGLGDLAICIRHGAHCHPNMIVRVTTRRALDNMASVGWDTNGTTIDCSDERVEPRHSRELIVERNTFIDDRNTSSAVTDRPPVSPFFDDAINRHLSSYEILPLSWLQLFSVPIGLLDGFKNVLSTIISNWPKELTRLILQYTGSPETVCEGDDVSDLMDMRLTVRTLFMDFTKFCHDAAAVETRLAAGT